MNNAKRERVKRIIKCMKFQLIFNRLLINLQLKWLINGCSTYWYIYECMCGQLNGLIDMQTEAIRLTKVLAWRMDAAASAEQEISAITTHTHTTTKRKRENRQDAATDEMIHWGHWTWWQSSSERARWGREMYGKCLQTFAWNQQINKASTVRPTRDSEGETWRASEKNFMWQVKWKFLHKSKLKVLKIAKGLKLNFTILTSAKGCSREGGKESSLFFLALLLGQPLLLPLPPSLVRYCKEGPVNLYALLLLLFRRFVLLFTCWILCFLCLALAFIFVCCVCPLGKFLVACWFSNLR